MCLIMLPTVAFAADVAVGESPEPDVLVPLATDTTIAVDATNFPDASFRSYVAASFDTDSSGFLDTSSLAVTTVDVSLRGIADLTGLRHFPALVNLYCSDNQITALDLSQNPSLKELDCWNNRLMALDLSHSALLRYLDCGKNQLADLDVSHNAVLSQLACDNNQLTELDLTHNPVMQRLSFADNHLSELDVTHNPALIGIECTRNHLYDIAGLTADSSKGFWRTAGQTLIIPAVPDPSVPGAFISEHSYALKSGSGIAMGSGASYDFDTGRFKGAALDTPYTFTTATPAGSISGHVTLVVSATPATPALSIAGPATATAGEPFDVTVSLANAEEAATLVVSLELGAGTQLAGATAEESFTPLAGFEVVDVYRRPGTDTYDVTLSAWHPGVTLDAAAEVLRVSLVSDELGDASVTLVGAELARYLDATTADVEVALPQGSDATVTVAVEEPPVVWGAFDFNRDGKETLADLAFAQLYYR
ncbi:MAG: leucine-rich repeat domain-containing protein, partial [Coriobacteriales bacterium]|nr:leucine-rich repeat domain-containing protein [Coriobacteriales bacterium]